MSDAEGLDVEWFDATTAHRGDEPGLTNYRNLNGYINAAADREWFQDFQHFDLGAVPDEGLLVFRPGDDGHYQFSRENGYGADVSVTAAIKHHWGDLGLEETAHVPMHQRGDVFVADLSDLLDGGPDTDADEATMSQAAPESSGSYPTADSGDTVEEIGIDEEAENSDADVQAPDDILAETHSSQPLLEYYLVDALSRGEREFVASEVAAAMDADIGSRQIAFALSGLKDSDESPFCVRKTGQTSQNGSTVWRVEPSVALAAKLPGKPGVDLESVLGEEIESVQELAEKLDIEEGEARRRAMDAGAYTDLQDNVDRPGVRD